MNNFEKGLQSRYYVTQLNTLPGEVLYHSCSRAVTAIIIEDLMATLCCTSYYDPKQLQHIPMKDAVHLVNLDYALVNLFTFAAM